MQKLLEPRAPSWRVPPTIFHYACTFVICATIPIDCIQQALFSFWQQHCTARMSRILNDAIISTMLAPNMNYTVTYRTRPITTKIPSPLRITPTHSFQRPLS